MLVFSKTDNDDNLSLNLNTLQSESVLTNENENEEPNGHFFGLTKLIQELEGRVTKKHGFPPPKMKMLEIGSYMGESTMLFASSNLFS